MVVTIEKKSYESRYKSGFIKTALAVLTVLLLLAVFAMPASAVIQTDTINPGDSLADAIANAETGDIIVLNSGTYNIDRQIVISDKNVTLKSNPDVFINKDFDYIGFDDGIFKVNTTDGRLILDGTSGLMTIDGQDKGRLIYVSEGAEFIIRANVYSVVLRNGDVGVHTGTRGGAVYVTGKHSLFSMDGGQIAHNNASFGGGAVEVSGYATFNMYNGIIGGVTNADKNTAPRGAAVDIEVNGIFNMYGGKISNNYAAFDGGGIKSWGTFNMYDGEISSNSVAPYVDNCSRGGGVFLQKGDSNSTFNMYGGKISNNTAEDFGGGVFAGNTHYEYTYGPVINIYNGTISYNEADTGGGVYITSGSTLNIYNGTISDNNATAVSLDNGYGGGGVGVSGFPRFIPTKLNMYGGNISHNKATNGIGGGVLIINYTASTIHGGNISDNIGNNAVVIDGGTGGGINFKMYGGTISNSTASPYVMDSKGSSVTFKMYGGTIIGERTGSYDSDSPLEIGKAVNEARKLASGFENDTGGDMMDYFNSNYPIYTIYGTPEQTKTVSFNGNGGSGSMNNIQIPGVSKLSKNTFDKTGYSFDVWKANRTGIRFIDEQDSITYTSFGSDVSNDEILDAQWNPNEYNITYDVNGGTKIIGPESGNVTYDSIVRSMPKASKTMYIFNGWNTDQYGTGDFVLSSTIYNFTASDTRLFANYTGNTTILNFTTYCTSTQPDINVNYSSLVEPIIPPTNPGYNFSGYFIGDNATGKQLYKYDGTVNTSLDDYVDTNGNWTNSSLPHGSILPLHANWTANVVTLNFTTYSVTPQDDITATYNATLDALSIPTKAGYNFGGYLIGDNATGLQLYKETGAVNTSLADYVDTNGNWINTTLVNGSTLNLYAKWNANTTTITLDGNGGTGGTPSVTATYDSGVLPTIVNPSKTGYTFNGWFVESTGETKVINVGGTFVNDVTGWVTDGKWANTSSTATLYANWTANTTTITLDGNGGTGGSTSVTATYDSGVLPTIVNPSKTGYTFNGWFVESTGETKVINVGGTFVNDVTGWVTSGKWANTSSTATLYANWTANTTVIALNVTGGTGGSTSVTATYGSSDLVPAITNPSKTGYTFGGWFTESAGGDKIINETGWLITGDVTGWVTSGKWANTSSTATLYANWTANEYKVTVISSTTGHVNPNKTSSIHYNETVTLSVVPEAGYELETLTVKGDDDNSIISVSSNKFNMPAQNVTVSATFRSMSSSSSNSVGYGYLTYEVFFDSQGGSHVDNISNLPYGAIIKEPVTPTKEGNTFDGWYTEDDYKWNFPTDKVTKTFTLYAKWTSESTQPVTTTVPKAEQPQSPLGLVGLIAGLGCAFVVLKRNK